MRDYEIVVVLQPDLDDASLSGLVDKIGGWIKDFGGKIAKVDHWGKRKLAYPIRKHREGFYVLLNAQMVPASVRELERNLQYTEPVLRYLVTLAA